MNQRYLIFISFLLLIILLAAGFTIANHKRLWNDEIYTQVGIEKNSYGRIISGKIEEGNNAPLYYLVQKIVNQLIHYSSPMGWRQSLASWKVNHQPSRLMLRITPVIYMSFAIVAIFYYFSRYYSIWTGLYSLFITFASLMVWRYWAEARPYGLWVLLTTIQSLLFLHILNYKDLVKKIWPWLIVVNVLLALTSFLSITQTIIISVLLAIWVERDWKKYIWFAGVPLLISLYYYFHAPSPGYFEFSLTPDQLIRECFSRERFYLLYLFLLYFGLYALQKKTRFPSLYKTDVILKAIPYFMFTILMLLAVGLILLIFKIKERHVEGLLVVPIASRHFINLTPIGIIAVTLITHQLLKSFRDKPWMQILIAMGVGSLVVPRFFKTVKELKNYFQGLFG